MEDKRNAITVLGSANCDYFFVVDRLPSVGETLSANSVMICCGGKGANQASTIGNQNYRVNFIAQVGNDSAGPVILNTLKEFNVDPSSISTVENIPTGQAYIFSLPSKDNSIVLVGGANTNWKNDSLANIDKHLASCKLSIKYSKISSFTKGDT
jgi:ribokinase